MKNPAERGYESTETKARKPMTTLNKLEWIAFVSLFPLSAILGAISSKAMRGPSHFPKLPKPQLLLKFKNHE